MKPTLRLFLAGCTAGLFVLSSCTTNAADDATEATTTTVAPSSTARATTTVAVATSTTAPATTVGTTTATTEAPSADVPTDVEFEITRGCAQTFHSPLDENSLSFIRWTFDAPGLGDDTAVEIAFSDGSTTFTEVRDQEIIAEQGISAYGAYNFASVAWTTTDGVETSIAVDGTHVVDEREGDASETCIG